MAVTEPSADTRRTRGTQLISVLRLVALSLLVLGFSGWLIDDGGEVALDSPFTIAFATGVGCAILSIYLGILLANRSD